MSLTPDEHRRQRDEVVAEGARGQARQRRLADAGRPPQDHRMRLAAFECQPQRLARADQMGLADDLVERRRAQRLGQRRRRQGPE